VENVSRWMADVQGRRKALLLFSEGSITTSTIRSIAKRPRRWSPTRSALLARRNVPT
jgi:hypothetical protein